MMKVCVQVSGQGKVALRHGKAIIPVHFEVVWDIDDANSVTSGLGPSPLYRS